MDHGGEPARPTTTVGSAEFADFGMAGPVQGSEANIGSAVVRVAAEFHRQHELGGGVAYHNIGASWRQLGPVGVVLVGPQLLPDGALRVHDNHGYYSLLQPRPGAIRGVTLVDLLHGGGCGALYNGDYSLQPRPGAGHGEVFVDLLPDGAGHGEAFVSLPPGGGGASFEDYVYYSLRPRPGAGHGEVLVGLLPDGDGHGEVFVGRLPDGAGHGEVFVGRLLDGAGHGEVFVGRLLDGAGHGEVFVGRLPDGAEHGEVVVGLLPAGGGAMHDDYGYYLWQPRLGAGCGEVLVDRLPDGAMHGDNGFYAWQPRPGARRGEVHGDNVYYSWQPRPGAGRGEVLPDGVDGIAGALRGPNIGEGNDNRGVVAEHLHRLLPLAGIGASSVAINGLAAGPGSPAAAFELFVLLLGGMFLVILHVLHV